MGLSRGPHPGKGCLGGFGSSHAFPPGSRGMATPEGGFPGVACWGNSAAGVRGRAPFNRPLRLGTARRVRWGYAGGPETRSTQRMDFFPPTCPTPQWRRKSAKLFLSLLLVIRSCPDPRAYLPVKEAILEMAFVCVTLAVSANLFSQFA